MPVEGLYLSLEDRVCLQLFFQSPFDDLVLLLVAVVLSLQLGDTLLESLEGVLDSVILLETCRWLLLESFVALSSVIVL